jgi:hypothetical protein
MMRRTDDRVVLAAWHFPGFDGEAAPRRWLMMV